MEQSDAELLATLLDYGFEKGKAEFAVKNSKDRTIEGLIEFLEKVQNQEEGVNVEKKEVQANINEEKKEEKPFADQSQPIGSMVNQEFSAQLQSMGYSKNVSEKALFLTQNVNLEKAIDWINENKASPDFEEELRIVGQEEGPKLSKEEAAQKAKELQQKIREKRLAREKEEELERERNRIKGGKALNDARRELEEMQLKRDMEAKMRQKREDELARQKILAELERDRQERFGRKPAGAQQSAGVAPLQQKPKTPLELVDGCIKQLKIAYPSNIFPGAWNTALKTINIYLENLVKNPGEEKFRKINLGNETFQKRVGNWIGAIGILKEAGFQEDNGFLVIGAPNVDLIKKIIDFITKSL